MTTNGQHPRRARVGYASDIDAFMSDMPRPRKQDVPAQTRLREETARVTLTPDRVKATTAHQPNTHRADEFEALSTYPVLLIDPPWQFRVWNEETGQGRSAESHYDTVTLDDLCALPMHQLMAKDCAVFLWATWPTLVEAIELGEAWGLTYKTCAFNWVKLNKMQRDTPFLGMGYWTRANSEPCLLFTKGSPRRRSLDVPQMLIDWEGGLFETETIATPIGRHSEKPQAIYQRIEALVPGPYCEVFARQRRAGWTSLGDELSGLDIREELALFGDEVRP